MSRLRGTAAVSSDVAPMEGTLRPAVDPGSNMRIVGDSGALRDRLRPVVVDMQRRAVGRVLDIRGPLASGFAYEAVRELVVAPPSSVADRPGEHFDTVCSFGALSAAPTPDSLVAALAGLLGSDGRLLFVELDGDARRWRRRLDRIARRRWGMSMSRDISGGLWAGGFELTSLDRRLLRRGVVGSLRVVVGAARLDPHRTEAPQGADGAAP